jgi:hypothetical protein
MVARLMQKLGRQYVGQSMRDIAAQERFGRADINLA